MIGLLNSLPSVSGKDTNWDSLGPMLGEAFGQTLYMVCVAMLIGGVAGLAIGVLLYTTRDGGVLRNKFVYQVLNVLINFVRPIPRLVEQNLMSIDPGVIEAARAMGASPWRIIRTVVVPEALGPLVLGYTFAFIAVVDMSAMAGYIGGGGLGNFAITYGYQAFDWNVTLVTTLVIIFIVQLAQIFGNWLSKKIMRR